MGKLWGWRRRGGQRGAATEAGQREVSDPCEQLLRRGIVIEATAETGGTNGEGGMARKPVFENGMTRRETLPFQRSLRARGKRDKLKPALPLVHSTTVWSAQEIAEAERFILKRCDVFDKDLVYFFVMRPAYRSRFAGAASHQLSRFPVAFILPPTDLPDPFHVYPFDTGGAAKGAFQSQHDPQVPLEDYALTENLEAASAHIEWAFETAERYLDGDVRADLLDGVEEADMVTRGYADVANMGRKNSNDFDRRSSAVEVAFSRDIPMRTAKGLVVLPRQLLENKALIEKFEAFGYEVDAYDWRPNTLPDEYEDYIAEAARAWYHREGWLP